MGMWENDCRHGSGVVVTLEGLYIQGIFLQNKMMVCNHSNYGFDFTRETLFTWEVHALCCYDIQM